MSSKVCINSYRTILKHFKTLPTISGKENTIRNSVIERVSLVMLPVLICLCL